MSQSPDSLSKSESDTAFGPQMRNFRPSESFARATMVGGESDNNSATSDSSNPNAVTRTDNETMLPAKMKLEVKRVFGARSKECECCLSWHDTYPSQDVEAKAVEAENEERARYSILHRQTRHAGDTAWKTHSIEINNPMICAFISKCLDDYPGEKFSKSKIILKPPYMALFHRFRQIQITLEKEGNDELNSGCRLLFDILLEDWKPFSKDFEEFQSSGLITHQSVWTIFPPGELVVLKINNDISIGRVCSIMTESVDVTVIDYTGSKCEYTTAGRSFYYFKGLQRVIDLHVYPLRCDDNRLTLEKRLTERGRRFEALKGRHTKYFKGGEQGSDTRVVIDASAYYKFESRWISSYRESNRDMFFFKRLDFQNGHITEPWDKYSLNQRPRGIIHRNEIHHHYEDEDTKVYHHQDDYDETFSEENETENEQEDDLWPLTESQLLLTVPYVRGFDLQRKIWGFFNIDRLEDVFWNDDAFKQLVLNSDQKRLIWALAKQKSIEDAEFDDFISGKGKGVIILLCGPPGVGKTLTAESVSELLKVPLYILGANDLGTDATKAEEALRQSMDLCAYWKCVMLIDEADVFMGERHIDSLKRNELVSVFLRLIEYYTGIMFLTTNRFGTLDHAFCSRIDLIIPFANLDQLARGQVWKTFIETLPGHLRSLEDADYESLSEWQCNGREIKSAVKTGLILAKSENDKLRLCHLQAVLRTRQEANEFQQRQQEEARRLRASG